MKMSSSFVNENVFLKFRDYNKLNLVRGKRN